jgi:hypothetical protein
LIGISSSVQLLDGFLKSIHGSGKAAIGNPPKEADKDWVVLLQAKKD